MAYQNVGTPRFYIDYFTYWQSIGMIKEITNVDSGNSLVGNPIGLDPSSITTLTNNDKWSFRCKAELNNPISMRVIDSVNYCGILGHNLGNINITPDDSSSASQDDLFLAYRLNYKNTDWATTTPESGTNWRGSFTGHSNGFEDIINTEGQINGTGLEGQNVNDFIKLPNSGFSLCKPHTSTNNAYDDIQFFEYRFLAFDNSALEGAGNWSPTWSAELQTNSLVMGHFYDMPVSPDLDVKMEIEFDGYDTAKTLGGSTLTNIRYEGNPKWGNNNAWEIGESNPYYRRRGRRSWNLKFSYISDEDIFSSNYSSNNWLSNTTDNTGYNSDDLTSDENNFEYTLADDDSFSAKVLNFISSGQRFIFQPDNKNNNPDQFAICVLDQESLEINQTAFKSYEISLTIREVW